MQHDNLKGWLNPPTVQDAVLSYMEQIAAPMLLREIYRPLQLPASAVNRVLTRLHDRGLVARWPIPVEYHRFDRRTCRVDRTGAERMCYLYEFVDEDEPE